MSSEPDRMDVSDAGLVLDENVKPIVLIVKPMIWTRIQTLSQLMSLRCLVENEVDFVGPSDNKLIVCLVYITLWILAPVMSIIVV